MSNGIIAEEACITCAEHSRCMEYRDALEKEKRNIQMIPGDQACQIIRAEKNCYD